jgi:alpha-galactosidase
MPKTRPASDHQRKITMKHLLTLPTALLLMPLAALHAETTSAAPADIAGIHAWASAAFGAGRSESSVAPAQELFLAANQTPFSFTYDSNPSTELLKTCAHTVELQDLPDCVQHTASWTDGATHLRITAVVSAYKSFPAIEWVLYFENQGKRDTPIIENIQALDVRLRTGDRPATLHRIAGDNCSPDAFQPLEIPIETTKQIHLAPVGGRSSNGTFPFFNVAAPDQGLFTAIGWSGQWAATLDRQSGGTRLTAGMELTHLVLHPGEKIRTPRILLMGWNGDLQAAHNRFRRLMLAHYAPQLNGKPVAIPAFSQCYDRYKDTPKWSSEAGQIHAAEVAKEIGLESLWLDAAWFPGSFPKGVGNWTTHERFPNGLKPVSAACHTLGLQFLLWFEPERVGLGSQIAHEHPDFVHPKEPSDKDWSKTYGLFKLDDPIARRWITDLMLQRIKEYGVDWWRTDFNIDPLPFWRKNDAPDRQGMTEIRYIEGLYAMWDEIRAKNPGLVIDNCASGGRRIDLETCMRAVSLWQSDISCQRGAEDAHQAQNICLSLYFPLHTPCAWNADAYELRSCVTAGLVTQFDFLNPGFSIEKAHALVDEVKSYRKFWYGDVYPLTPISPAADKQLAFELWRPDLKEGIVMCFRRSKCGDDALSLKLHGLDPDHQYQVWSVEGLVPKATLAGRDLMTNGIVIHLPGPRTSDVIHFRDVADRNKGTRP